MEGRPLRPFDCAQGRLERAIARLRRRQLEAKEKAETGTADGRMSAAAFRAAAEERLRHLEREVSDLKGRINGLIFLVAGTVITQVILKLVQ